MHNSLLVRQVAPALLGYFGLIATTIVLDLALHRAGWTWVGAYLGPIGTGLILLSFLYSLRKRKRISFATPKRLLELHETLSWVGTLCILVHAGIHVHAILPWLAVVAMLVVVASGFTGSVLVKRAMAARPDAAAIAGSEARAALDAMTLEVLKRWRTVHLPINAVFAALFGVHLAVILLLRHW